MSSTYKDFDGDLEAAVARAERIARDPLAASDAEKLRAVADLLDMLDRKAGVHGRQMQEDVRRIANYLDDLTDKLRRTASQYTDAHAYTGSVLISDVLADVRELISIIGGTA